jgi:hypothetical protein
MNRRRVIVAILLVLSIGNYFRLHHGDDLRMIDFFSVFVMGALAGILALDIVISKKKETPDKS